MPTRPDPFESSSRRGEEGLRLRANVLAFLLGRRAMPRPDLRPSFHRLYKGQIPEVVKMLHTDYDYVAEVPRPVDERGRPTDYDGDIKVQSLSPDIATVEVIGPRLFVVRTVKAGTFDYRVSADGALAADEVKTYVYDGTEEVSDSPGDAVGILPPGFQRVAKGASGETEEPVVA